MGAILICCYSRFCSKQALRQRAVAPMQQNTHEATDPHSPDDDEVIPYFTVSCRPKPNDLSPEIYVHTASIIPGCPLCITRVLHTCLGEMIAAA